MALLASLALTLPASRLVADILDNDDDEEPGSKVDSEPENPGVAHPAMPPRAPGKVNKGGKGKAGSGDDEGDEGESRDGAKSDGGKSEDGSKAESGGGKEAAPKGLTPHPKETVSGATTTVIPPKNPAKAKKDNARDKNAPKEPVHFESKGLKGLREKGMVELLQDVVVTQGAMKLEADYAQVFFAEASHEVLRVEAQGNVRINGVDENSGEHFKAYGDKAVFLNSDRTIVLEGNAKLWRGEDSMIRSRKITYEMNTGWIRADRVAGEVQPDDKMNDAAKGQPKATEKKK